MIKTKMNTKSWKLKKQIPPVPSPSPGQLISLEHAVKEILVLVWFWLVVIFSSPSQVF